MFSRHSSTAQRLADLEATWRKWVEEDQVATRAQIDALESEILKAKALLEQEIAVVAGLLLDINNRRGLQRTLLGSVLVMLGVGLATVGGIGSLYLT